MGDLFEPWVDECPLRYAGNNAPKKVNVLGSFLLSTLAGQNRYAHITSLMGDSVNSKLLGMTKDSAKNNFPELMMPLPGNAWIIHGFD